jgi:hypothetical protein
MNRNEAFKAMIDGHKIKHKSWDHYYCYFNDIRFVLCLEKSKSQIDLKCDLIEPDDYEIYTEKKTEKVSWYKITCHSVSDSRPMSCDYLFKSEDHFLDYYKESKDDYHWIKLEEVCTHEYEVIE